MKAGIILCIVYALLISTGCSQSNRIINGYAFARSIMPGVKPRVSIAENGTITEKHEPACLQYFIYTETKDSTPLEVKSIWIKGKEYVANAEKIKEIPVTIAKDSFILHRESLINDNPNLTIWQINVGEMISSHDKSFPKPSQLKDTEVVINFLYKTKIQHFFISKLQYLEPMRLE